MKRTRPELKDNALIPCWYRNTEGIIYSSSYKTIVKSIQKFSEYAVTVASDIYTQVYVLTRILTRTNQSLTMVSVSK